MKKILQDRLLKKIIKNSGIIFFGHSTASVLSVISFTIMANIIGPETLAIFVLAQSYSMILNDIFNIQTWESMIKFGSAQTGKQGMTNVIKTNVFLDAVSAVLAAFFALLFVYPVGSFFGWEEYFLPVISIYSISILFNITTLTIGIPRLFDQFSSLAKIQVSMSFLKLILILIAMATTNRYEIYIYIFLLIDILQNISLITFSTVLLNRSYGRGWWKTPLKFDQEQIKFIWWTNLRSIIRIPVQRLDMIVISSILSMKTVGVYKVYKEVASLINRLGEPINQAIFPEFTKLLGKKDLSKTSYVTKKAISLLSCVSFVVMLSLFISSEFLVGTFFGAEYLPELNVLYILLIIVGISFALVPINSLFIAAGFARLSFFIVLFTNTAYLITIFLSTKLLGLYGVVLAFAVQMVLNQGLKVIFLRKYSSDWGSGIR